MADDRKRNLHNAERPLTAKQQRFVSLYLIEPNATKAYRAVYGGTEPAARAHGARLVAKGNIMVAIAAGQRTIAEKAGLTAAYVLGRLVENLERAMQAIPVMEFDHEKKAMVTTGEYRYEGAVANRAAELLGKHLGLFPERVIVRDPDQMTDAELEALATDARKRLRLMA